jgi:hypothetical protein
MDKNADIEMRVPMPPPLSEDSVSNRHSRKIILKNEHTQSKPSENDQDEKRDAQGYSIASHGRDSPNSYKFSHTHTTFGRLGAKLTSQDNDDSHGFRKANIQEKVKLIMNQTTTDYI